MILFFKVIKLDYEISFFLLEVLFERHLEIDEARELLF